MLAHYAWFFALFMLFACGGDNRSMYRGSGGGNDDGGGGTGGAVDLAEELDLANNNSGPQISKVQLQKVAVPDPKTPTLLKATQVVLTVDVSPGTGAAVDTVQAILSGQMVPTTLNLRAGTTYEATLDLSTLKSGAFTLTISATNIRKITNTLPVKVIYDSGPVITMNSPKSGLSYRLSAAVQILARGDATITGGDIQTLKASIQSVPVTLTIDNSNPYAWLGQGTIVFRDPAFKAALSGVQIVHVEATDKNGATTAGDYSFTIDEAGPTLAFVTPTPGEIVGGVINVTVRATDPSGVADGSVIAVWLNDPTNFSVNLTRIPGSDSFTARFDTRRLPNPTSLIYPALSFRAQDRLGNQSDIGGQLILDNTQPVMALDPPLTQVRQLQPAGGGYSCSFAFDPVGDPIFDTYPYNSGPIKDKQVYGQLVTIRARIADRGNQAEGALIEYLSGIDNTSVDALVTPMSLSGTPVPLVVDTDGKNVCNNLNPNLTPVSTMTMSGQALILRLSPITSVGQAQFTARPLPQFAGACDQIGTPNMPTPLCDVIGRSEPFFTYVIPNEIWTIGPVTGKACGGLQLDSLNVLPEGPYCVAVRGRDTVGNSNISKPVRICIERPLGSGACKAFQTAAKTNTLPTCVGHTDGSGNIVAGQCSFTPTAPFPLVGLEPYTI